MTTLSKDKTRMRDTFERRRKGRRKLVIQQVTLSEEEIIRQMKENIAAATTTWRVNAAVMILEVRRCTSCGSRSTAASGVRVELVRVGPFPARKLTSPSVLPPSLSLWDLPRRADYVETSVDCCQHCFEPDYEGGTAEIQMRLPFDEFSSEQQPRLTKRITYIREVEEGTIQPPSPLGKKKVTLDDF